MGHPIQLCSPEDEGPTGAGEPLLAVCLPLTHAKRSSMSKRCRPGLVPLPIADCIAQHEHGVDVLPTPAHAGPFEAGFDDPLVGTFDAPRANGPACVPDSGGYLICVSRLCQLPSVSRLR